MSYEVIARKWRPQQFGDVVGQEHVVRTLRNAIEAERIAHAYLFVGPRGIGKTSVARILAKALNCKEGPTLEPCDKCEACTQIIAGNSLDVMEIDGASNNSVDQVRDLRETVKFAPVNGRYKIYIIDEVHMLSNAAFNALLKTLEEPPAHVKFVFATTEPEKVLATIVSRCQRFDLRRIPVGHIVERLKLIADEEGIAVDDDALLAIARGSEGGLRDAESALDQLISFCGNEISEENVLSVFGLVARDTLENLAGAVLGGDIPVVIRLVGELDDAGKDLQRLLVELLEHFRNLLVCLHVEDPSAGLDLTDAQLAGLKEQAGTTDTERLLRIADILTDTGDRMKFALSKRTILETALIRCAHAVNTVTLQEVLKRLGELEAGGGGAALGEARGGDSAGPESPSRPPVAPDRGGAGTRQSGGDPPSAVSGGGYSESQAARELAMLTDRWVEIVERVGRIAIMARSALVDAKPASVRAESVSITFDPEFGEEKKNMETPRNRKAVEHVVGELLRRTVSARFAIGESVGVVNPGDVLSDVDTSDTSGGDEESEDIVDAPPQADRGAAEPSRQELIRDEAVQTALEMFDGSVTDVRQ